MLQSGYLSISLSTWKRYKNILLSLIKIILLFTIKLLQMAIDEKLKMNFLNSITGFILSKSLKIKCHSVQFSHSVVSDSLQPHES